jgi:oxygen-independent coproporphyrinogen-3 oxidase
MTTQPPEEQVVAATTRDGAKVALTRFAREGSEHPPVLLTHGTFSNSKLCLKLARHLQQQGFDSWVLDWRGHGKSERGAPVVDYETLALHEVETALRCVREHTGRESLYWLGHSAGGVLPFIYLAHHPEAARNFHGIVALASQTTHAGPALTGRLKLRLGQVVTGVLGKAPGPLFQLGPEDEPRPLISQWFRWNLSGKWLGQDGFDYLQKLGAVRVSALCLAGGNDTFIAPRQGCHTLFEALGSQDKTFVHCTRSEGFRQDFTHGGLIAGSAAQEEIWPLVTRWMAERSARKLTA